MSAVTIRVFLLSPFGLAVILIGLLIFRFQLDMQVDPDLFARLAVGRIIVETGSIPLKDVFAFTPTKPLWIDHEWLSGLVFYLVYEKSGELGLFLLKLVFAFLSCVFLFRAQSLVAGKEVSLVMRLSWMLILGAFISLVWHTTLRSQVFTYFFLSWELLALVAYQRIGTSIPLLLLIPCMPIWANCHGGFVVGLGFLGIHTLCQWRKPGRFFFVATILAGCVVATLINPYGIKYWSYILEAISMKRELIKEWSAVSPLSGEAIALNFVVAIVLFDALIKKGRYRFEESILLAVALFYGYRHFRFIPIPLMVATVYFSPSFSRLAADTADRFRYFYGEIILEAVVLVAVGLGWIGLYRMAAQPEGFSLNYRLMPTQAVEWLQRERPGGRILSSYRHGNYLLWKLSPRFKVATDGRYEEVYSDQTFKRAYIALDPMRDGHAQALAEVNPDLIIIDRRLHTSATKLFYGEMFVEAYRDVNYSIFERSPHTLSEMGGEA